jgi:hypothetical protein
MSIDNTGVTSMIQSASSERRKLLKLHQLLLTEASKFQEF